MRILLVEDDPALADATRRALAAQGWTVDCTARGEPVPASLKQDPYDLLLLDIGLAGIDGFETLRRVREQGSTTPVLMLTARDAVEDRVRGLEGGADDYLVKPFGAGELMARVRAQLRRQTQRAPAADAKLAFGDVEVDLARRIVTRGGEPLHLTPIEYRLLTHLAGQPDRVITHRQLLQAVWGPGHTEDTHYVRVHMANLRKKIEHDASQPRHLLTVSGVGYRFVG